MNLTVLDLNLGKDKRVVYDKHGNLIEVWDDATGKLIERRFYRFVVGNT